MATEELLQAEARERPRIAIAAGLAAVLTLAAPIIGLVVLKDAPDNLVSEALQREQHLTGLALSALCSVLGLIALTFVLDFLLRALRARTAALPWQLRPLLLAGGVGLAILLTVLQVVTTVKYQHFANDGTQTYEEARAINDYGALSYVGILAQLSFAGAFVMIAVTAMRAGLLTRFLGYLGVISAVLFVIPLVPIPIVQAYWLGAVAAMLVGRSSGGLPPAWRSGEAIPWPSTAEMRDQRVREAEARRGGDDPLPPGPASEPAEAAATPARRKRKKRR